MDQILEELSLQAEAVSESSWENTSHQSLCLWLLLSSSSVYSPDVVETDET